MKKPKVYLDNCCYGRPFDDLTQERINNEASAKMYIQTLIKFKSLILYTSFMLFNEINDNPFTESKEHILNFINEYTSVFVDDEDLSEIKTLSEEAMKTGIKKKDATHLACSIYSECDYFITVDKRVLNYKTDKIKIVNPIEFVKIWGGLT